MNEVVQWTSPPPMWAGVRSLAEAATRQDLLRRPAILRFANDEFMDEFMGVLERDPARLREFVAQPETWRGPGTVAETVRPPALPSPVKALQRLGLLARRKSGAATIPALPQIVPRNNPPPLKLYQPAHQRHYLVTACLVCGRVGLPDKKLKTDRQEKVSYVVRRLLPPGALNVQEALPRPNETWDECAFLVTEQGSGWQRVGRANTAATQILVKGEEQLPLFALNFTQDDGQRRRLFASTIPVARREAYMMASALSPAGVVVADKPPDSRIPLMRTLLREPWQRMLERAASHNKLQFEQVDGNFPLPGSIKNQLKDAREQIQTASWYALLDFAKYLETYLPRVWQKLETPNGGPTLNQPENALLAAMNGATLSQALKNALKLTKDNLPLSPVPTFADNLGAALLAIRGKQPYSAGTADEIERKLDNVVGSYNREGPDPRWPRFLFPLADPSITGPLPNIAGANTPTDKVNFFARLVEAALPEQSDAPRPQMPLAAKPVMDMREGWFVLRCVFERPECGALDPPLLSEPTQPFQMAGFFDPDAPARPIRIALPLDTTPAGLRKFDKNTAFMMSDVLCGQVKRAQGLSLGDLIRTVLPWPLNKELSLPDGGACSDSGLTFGMICSLSLPIITICALILLFVIVLLLDFIFRWMPFFFICFPLPGFKAKSE